MSTPQPLSPPPEPAPDVKRDRPSLAHHLVAYTRFTLIALSTLLHASLVALTPRFARGFKDKTLQSWGRSLAWLMGLKVTREGTPHAEGGIVIANHTSYADIPALMALAPCTFLAKAEVARWPLIGWAARVVGTVFVDRSSPESRAASRETLKQRVREGARILVFAEGTTTPRGEVHPLKPGMFHEAAEAGLPIQLISLEFERDEHAWVGDTPLWPHFVSVFGRRHTRAHITVHSELLRGDDAHALREQAEAWLKRQASRSRG